MAVFITRLDIRQTRRTNSNQTQNRAIPPIRDSVHGAGYARCQGPKEVSLVMIPTISIVDDDPAVREATMDLFRAMGFAAQVFTCAEDF